MSQRLRVTFVLSVSLLLVFTYLLARIWNHIPSVSPDEYIHAKFARYVDIANVEIPSYLYYVVYRVTVIFNDQFLNAARVLNALFYVAGCYLVYIVARRFISEWLASYVAMIAAMSPINIYVNYFMPEAMFFFFFWLFVVVITNKRWRLSHKGNILIGTIFGALLLVKPHALIALPIYPLASIMVREDRYSAIKISVVFIATALFVKFAVSYLLSGTGGLTFFGSLYTRHLTDVMRGSIDIAYVVRSFFLNVFSNIFALASTFGLGLVYLLIISPDCQTDKTDRFIKWLIIWILVVYVPFVSFFAISTALFDVNISYRIYMRYYNYAFPLIFIYSLTHWEKNPFTSTQSERIGLVSIVIAPIIFIAYHYTTSLRMLPFMVLDNDTPDFYLISFTSLTLYCVLTTSIVIMIYWIWNTRQALKYYFYIYVPLLLILTNINNLKSIQGKNIATAADQAGIVASSIIPKAEQGNVLVLGYHDLELMRFLLYLNSSSSNYHVVGVNDSINIHNLDLNVRWAITIGNRISIDGATVIHQTDDYAIFRINE